MRVLELHRISIDLNSSPVRSIVWRENSDTFGGLVPLINGDHVGIVLLNLRYQYFALLLGPLPLHLHLLHILI